MKKGRRDIVEGIMLGCELMFEMDPEAEGFPERVVESSDEDAVTPEEVRAVLKTRMKATRKRTA